MVCALGARDGLFYAMMVMVMLTMLLMMRCAGGQATSHPAAKVGREACDCLPGDLGVGRYGSRRAR
jgi:hypothetical protein